MRKAFLLVNRAVASYIFPRASKPPVYCLSETFIPLSYYFPIFAAVCLSHSCNKFIFLFLLPLSTIKAHPKVHHVSPKG